MTLPTQQPLAITVLTPGGESVVSCQPGLSLRSILTRNGFTVHSACGGNATCGLCVVRVKGQDVMPPSAGELKRLSTAQLEAGLRLSCQVFPMCNLRVALDVPIASGLWRPLREDEYSTVIMPLSPCTTTSRYGVAVDIGTTHMRISLWDMQGKRRIDGRSCLNPQSAYGADVLTRLMEAVRSREIAHEIGGLAQQAITQALAEMASASTISLADIDAIWLVGNTAMLSLLSGQGYALLLQPEYWVRRIDCQPRDVSYLRDAWGMGPTTKIRFVPPMGGFIGSDLLASIIATRLIEQPSGALLIDFGTNSEIALWDGRVLRVTSAAGGPAFEGGGISCGMPGEAGAIYRVQGDSGKSFKLGVLGGGEPRGLCGSGLVDSVAWLQQNGRLDRVGRFVASDDAGLLLHESGNPISLKKSDIDAFQRAKAAIGAGVLWLCGEAGIPLSSLGRVYACGAFGRFLDVANAQSIGLLPSVPIETIELQGNTALTGCEALLFSSPESVALDALLSKAQVYNMAEEPAYERLFVENLYLQPMQD